jgi:hypothetical protein
MYSSENAEAHAEAAETLGLRPPGRVATGIGGAPFTPIDNKPWYYSAWLTAVRVVDDFAARVMGVDPARFGDDKSVILRRQGRMCLEPQVHAKVDNMTLAGLVAEEIRRWRPDAVFIDEGNGGGVIDRLRDGFAAMVGR